MAGSEVTDNEPSAPGKPRRRAILAAAAAVAGMAITQTVQPAAATGEVFAIPGNYSGNLFFGTVWSISNNSMGTHAHGIGGFAFSTSGSAGVVGVNSGGTGVYDATESASEPVNGLFGVYGQADSGSGVSGIATSGNGVLGTTTTTGVGVLGTANGSAIGVRGQSQSGPGVYGTTAGGYGVLGQTGTGGTFGLYGSALVNGAVGFGGVGYNGALAGQFSGPVTF